MYSSEQRKVSVDLLIQYDIQYSKVVDELGYPSPRELRRWYEYFLEEGTYSPPPAEREHYSDAEKEMAVNYYLQHGKNISRACRALGYPSRNLLTKWINERCPEQKRPCVKSKSLVQLDEKQKEQAVLDLCTRDCSAQEIATQYKVKRGSLYRWKKQLLPEGKPSEMPKNEAKSIVANEAQQIEELTAEIKFLSAEAEELKKQVHRLQLEKDALQMASEIIKKGQGISLDTLTNREKAMVIDALRNEYSLKELLSAFHIAKSSYCYQKQSMKRPDKYKDIRTYMKQLFTESYESYGYRRLYLSIKKPNGYNYSEKVIRRLMKEENLIVKQPKRRKYSSYQGEVSPAPENLIERNFHADKPNEKWLTDITEFHIPAGKVYLSPVIDCYDGLPVSWTIGTSPNADLVNSMLDEAISTLKANEHPIVHSDRGAHYRWPGWIERMENADLTRSMSKKGCSPDNSACEGFFGRLKNEMFYNRFWNGVTLTQFTEILNQYIHWYAEKRIKVSLGGLSPIQYRRAQGLI